MTGYRNDTWQMGGRFAAAPPLPCLPEACGPVL